MIGKQLSTPQFEVLRFLFLLIRERNLREIFSMYETSFTKLSERYFKGTTWPPVDAIAHLVEHDHVFCLLYKVRPLS